MVAFSSILSAGLIAAVVNAAPTSYRQHVNRDIDNGFTTRSIVACKEAGGGDACNALDQRAVDSRSLALSVEEPHYKRDVDNDGNDDDNHKDDSPSGMIAGNSTEKASPSAQDRDNLPEILRHVRIGTTVLNSSTAGPQDLSASSFPLPNASSDQDLRTAPDPNDLTAGVPTFGTTVLNSSTAGIGPNVPTNGPLPNAPSYQDLRTAPDPTFALPQIHDLTAGAPNVGTDGDYYDGLVMPDAGTMKQNYYY